MFKVADLLYMLKNAAHVSECMRTVARLKDFFKNRVGGQFGDQLLSKFAKSSGTFFISNRKKR